MKQQLKYIVIGALSLVASELVLEGIQYTNPPDWFRPFWLGLWVLFQILVLPAHFVAEMINDSLGLPLLGKPTLIEMGTLRTSILLITDALQGAVLGWLLFRMKSRSHAKQSQLS